MVSLKPAGAALLAAVLALTSPSALGMVVFDPANFLQAFMTVKEAVQQVAQLQAQLENQKQQLTLMYQQTKSMKPSQLVGILGDITGSDELRKLEKALAANRDLLDSLNNIRKQFDDRMDTAKLMKLTWKEYVAWEKKRLERKEESALARVQAEMHAIKRIESDYKFAKEQGEKITQTSGTHEAMQLMNLQMNRVLQQNAELMRQLSTAFGRATAEKEMQEAEDKARAKAQEDALRERVEAARVEDRAAIDAWKAGRKP